LLRRRMLVHASSLRPCHSLKFPFRVVSDVPTDLRSVGP